MATKGKLFVFEGPDGVGKTTLAQALIKEFTSKDIPCDYVSFPGRDEGTLGKHIYALHHNPSVFGINAIDPTSLQLLHIAAHIDLIGRRIRPALAAGRCVVLDRFWWSTWVYGVVTGVDRSTLQAMLHVEHTYWNILFPTITFLVTSDAPWRIEHTPSTWRKLEAVYYELAKEQEQYYPVQIISNNSSERETLDTIVQAIDDVDALHARASLIVSQATTLEASIQLSH